MAVVSAEYGVTVSYNSERSVTPVEKLIIGLTFVETRGAVASGYKCRAQTYNLKIG